MKDVTRILTAIERGDENVSAKLLPLVYQELRKLASAKLSKEKPGRTLQPTMLVHEAYVRLVDVDQPQQWNGRGHFFGAAAEAMRRILVEKPGKGKLGSGRTSSSTPPSMNSLRFPRSTRWICSRWTKP